MTISPLCCLSTACWEWVCSSLACVGEQHAGLSCNCKIFLISSSFYSSVATYSYSFFFSWVAGWALPSASEVLCVASVPVGGCHLSPLVTVHVCAAGKFHRRTCPQLSVIRTWIWHQLWKKTKNLFLKNESLDSPHNVPITISNTAASYWEPSCSESNTIWERKTSQNNYRRLLKCSTFGSFFLENDSIFIRTVNVNVLMHVIN